MQPVFSFHIRDSGSRLFSIGKVWPDRHVWHSSYTSKSNIDSLPNLCLDSNCKLQNLGFPFLLVCSISSHHNWTFHKYIWFQTQPATSGQNFLMSQTLSSSWWSFSSGFTGTSNVSPVQFVPGAYLQLFPIGLTRSGSFVQQTWSQ
jgi:hypothetical protein